MFIGLQVKKRALPPKMTAFYWESLMKNHALKG